MRSLLRASRAGGNSSSALRRVQEPPLPELALHEEYEVRRVLAEGCYARVLLARHRHTGTTVVLKAVHEELTALKDFCREFHYAYHLSPHPAVLVCYNVTFRADGCLVFAQEAAPLGDLASRLPATGLEPLACRAIARQLAEALAFMHSKELVHRDVRPENVLVFSEDYSKVKLGDFGATQREGSLVSRPPGCWLPFLPPEVYETVRNERYACRSAGDSWQLGVLLFACLTGSPPWGSADGIGDPRYAAFCRYRRRRTATVPPPFGGLSLRSLRMFRRLFEHKAERRAPVTEVLKYTGDRWLETEQFPQDLDRKNSVNLSLRTAEGSRHSQENNRNKLNKLISSCGLDSGAGAQAEQRVLQWVLACDFVAPEPSPADLELG